MQCIYGVHVFLVGVCVCPRAGWADEVCLVVIPVFSSPAEHTMHEYTHSHFTFHTLIHYSDGGQGTHIDYTDFFAQERQKESKNVVRNYADNTCLTGRNTDALKCVNTLKLTIFHAL